MYPLNKIISNKKLYVQFKGIIKNRILFCLFYKYLFFFKKINTTKNV